MQNMPIACARWRNAVSCGTPTARCWCRSIKARCCPFSSAVYLPSSTSFTPSPFPPCTLTLASTNKTTLPHTAAPRTLQPSTAAACRHRCPWFMSGSRRAAITCARLHGFMRGLLRIQESDRACSGGCVVADLAYVHWSIPIRRQHTPQLHGQEPSI
jgi:hypothetical protein